MGYLHWHHQGIRMGAGYLFFREFVSGMISKDGQWATQAMVDEAYNHLIKSLGIIEEKWINEKLKTKYMFGDKPSIVDLSLACELTQIISAGYDLSKDHPYIHAWYFGPMMEIKTFKELHDKSMISFKGFTESIRERQKEEGSKIKYNLQA